MTGIPMRFFSGTDRWTRAVFLLAVVSSLAVSLWAGRGLVTPQALVLVLGGGALYVVLGVYGSDLCERRRSLGFSTLYYAVQLTLAAFVLDQVYRLHPLSIAWIILLPLVGRSLLILPHAGTVAVAGVSLVIVLRPVVLLEGWEEVPAAAGAFVVSCLFVLAFVQLALGAERAREAGARLAAELSAAHRKISEHALEATELAAARERARLAREIHDSVGHCLTVANAQLEAAHSLLGQGHDQAAEALGKAQALTREGLAEIRRSVGTLHSSPLDGRTLPEALKDLVDDYGSDGLSAWLDVHGEPSRPAPYVELTLYRAVQERLACVREHARASSARVRLDYRDPQLIRVSVADDSVGGDAGSEAAGSALLGLRERVRLVGGKVDLVTSQRQGTELRVEVPA